MQLTPPLLLATMVLASTMLPPLRASAGHPFWLMVLFRTSSVPPSLRIAPVVELSTEL